MSVHTRPARKEDADFLARVLLLAARSHLERGFWDITLGSPEDACLAYLTRLAATSTRTWAHYSSFLVAEVDGRPAAGLSGYDPADAGFAALVQAMDEVADQLSWGAGECAAPWERFAPIATCMLRETPGMWIVENVATLPEYRRQGLVHRLLDEILDTGRRRGHRVAQITVKIGNTPALRAYQEVGFRVVEEKRHPDFEAIVGVPGLIHMRRDL
jgi:ribosomal protein S18 acetylase RimI-like enzyme